MCNGCLEVLWYVLPCTQVMGSWLIHKYDLTVWKNAFGVSPLWVSKADGKISFSWIGVAKKQTARYNQQLWGVQDGFWFCAEKCLGQ